MIEIEGNNVNLFEYLAIEDIDTLYKKLSDIEDKNNCVITINNIKETHMAALQILLSFKKTYPKVKFDIKDNDLKKLLKNMGLLNFFIKKG